MPPVGSSRAPPVGRQGLLRLDVLRRHVDAHRLRRLRHGRRGDDARCVESHPHVRVLLLGVPRDGVTSQDDALRPGKTNSRPGGSAQLAVGSRQVRVGHVGPQLIMWTHLNY